MKLTMTPEHKAELIAKRAIAHRDRNQMADFVEDLKRQYVPGMYASLTLQIAAEVLRNASIAQVTRARRVVNKRVVR